MVEYPFYLADQNETVTIRWVESVNATVRYGTRQGVYGHQISVSGLGKVEFVPSAEGMVPGIYYCRVSNGLIHSNEFPVYIESPQAPAGREPQNGAVINTISPKFTWDAVPGVPFYHFILTDQPVQIVRDEFGDLQIQGANIIYQAITGKTELLYGDNDPSGFFNQVNGIVPPLLNEKTYNWIILNNYGNNPVFSSIVQSGVQSFTVNVPVNINAPALLAPAHNAILSSREIKFSWSPVSGANSYQFEVFEIIEESGSSSTFPVWQVVTTNTKIDLLARQMLKSSYYEWHVIALIVSGAGKVSAKRNFTYDVPTGELNIRTRTISGNTVPRANVSIKPLQGSGENNGYLTSDSGILNLKVQPGVYEVSAMKTGFKDTTVTAEVEVNHSTAVLLDFELLPRFVIGKIESDSGLPIGNSTVVAKNEISRKKYKTISDLSGNFHLPLSASIYSIYAAKNDYTSADTVIVDLRNQFDITLPSPLRLIRNSGALSGKVTSQTGVPIFGVRITARQNATRVTTVSDINGAFQFTLGTGNWQFLAEKAGYSQGNIRTVSIAANQTINLAQDLVLNSLAANVSGMINDGNRGLEQAEIRATPQEGAPFTGRSNAKGSFNISLPANQYDFFFHKEGFIDPLPQHFDLSPGQSLNNLVIKLNPAPITVSGHVTSGGTPLSGVVVTSGSALDTSRINGAYLLFLPSGSHKISAAKRGYFLKQPVEISLSSGDLNKTKDIQLQPQAAIIKGTVKTNGTVIAFSSVFAIMNTDTVRTGSNENGGFLFSVQAGTWNVEAQKEGFSGDRFSGITVQPGQTIQGIDLNLQPDFGTITGRVGDDHGNLLANAAVICLERGKKALTNDDGVYQFLLGPGDVTLEANREGYGSQNRPITIIRNQTKNLDFSLSTFGTITGIITSSSGNPVNQVSIFLIQGTDTLRGNSDYTGEYRLHLAGGSYRLFADKLGYASAQQQISIQNGAKLTRNLQLQPKPEELAKISGKISLDQKLPLSSVVMTVSGKMNKTTQTNLDGNYSIEKLESGLSYLLRPAKRRYFFIPEQMFYQPLAGNKNNQNFTASPYGDLSGNQEVSSFDGSLILRISARKNVTPYFSNFPRDSLAGDVSGNKRISSFDASLIFRYVVGLINIFPAEQKSFGKKNMNIEKNPVEIFVNKKWLDPQTLQVCFRVSAPISFYSLDAELELPSAGLEPLSFHAAGRMARAYREWNYARGRMNIAVAATEQITCNDSLFSIVFSRMAVGARLNISYIHIKKIELDEGAVPVSISDDPVIPGHFSLSQNYPNPFNQSTEVRLSLPGSREQKHELVITVYNSLGQKVKKVVKKAVLPGTYTVRWQGDSDAGISLASGLYLLQVRYAAFHAVKKMILIR